MPLLSFEVLPKVQVHRKSQYESVMRKFSDSRREKCKYTEAENLGVPEVYLEERQYCTGSKFEGSYGILGKNGFGIYTLPNGTVYKGRLADGEFHGRGEMSFAGGDYVRGKWARGDFLAGDYYSEDGMQYRSDYCRDLDRRFYIEIQSGLNPVNKSYKTAEQPSRDIPHGYYDTGDGFYHPETRVVYKYDNLTKIVRTPLARGQQWIMQNCRRWPEQAVGPVPQLYEVFYEPTEYMDVYSTTSSTSWLVPGDPLYAENWKLLCESRTRSGSTFQGFSEAELTTIFGRRPAARAQRCTARSSSTPPPRRPAPRSPQGSPRPGSAGSAGSARSSGSAARPGSAPAFVRPSTDRGDSAGVLFVSPDDPVSQPNSVLMHPMKLNVPANFTEF